MVDYFEEYWIYIVDLESAAGDYFTRRDPTFRFKVDCFSRPCFCVLGPTLYVFQGYDYDSDADKFITHGKNVYTHPLPPSDTANLRLTRSMMSVAKAPLQGAKFWPTAVPTPDGKQILVVPTGRFRRLRDDWICSLELYDPSRQTSTVIHAKPLKRHRVRSAEFIGPRTVLFQTAVGRDDTHCLILDDVQGADPKWVDQREWNRNMERVGIRDSSFIIGHGWCFTPSGAYDISDGDVDRGRFLYPASSSSGEDLSSSTINHHITPLGDGDHDTSSFCCCTLRVGLTLRPFVMLDVYKFDFTKEVRRDEEKAPPSKRRKSSSPGMKIVKSIRFFDARQMDDEEDSFTTRSFFSIPTPAS